MKIIEHYVVPSGGISSLTLTSIGSIPGDYTDLMLIASARTNRTGTTYEDSLAIKLNNTSSSAMQSMYGYDANKGASDYNVGEGALRFLASTTSSTSGTFGLSRMYISDYKSSVNKVAIIEGHSENNGGGAWQFMACANFAVNSAITSITLTPLVGTAILENSSFSLYGILAGSDGTTTVS